MPIGSPSTLSNALGKAMTPMSMAPPSSKKLSLMDLMRWALSSPLPEPIAPTVENLMIARACPFPEPSPLAEMVR